MSRIFRDASCISCAEERPARPGCNLSRVFVRANNEIDFHLKQSATQAFREKSGALAVGIAVHAIGRSGARG
jgi:hypothetical protein